MGRNGITSHLCGGSIAHHKCIWQLLSWETIRGHLHPMQEHNEKLHLLDGKGASTEIQYQPCNEPNVGLGFNLCPDGTQEAHFHATVEKIKLLCQHTIGTYLTESETRQLLRQRLIPKLRYALHGTSFSVQQCKTIDKIIKVAFVPRSRINRNYPLPILHGPMEFGGLDFPDTAMLQDTTQLDYLIKQLRWDKVVAKYFLVALDWVQLCSGFTTPLLENVTQKLGYLQNSYIIDLRRRLATLDACLWIEKKWLPALQRVGDRALMEAFIEIPRVTCSQLRQANAVRLFLRVVTIADIADVAGRFIPAQKLNGEWRAGSDITWPYQPKPRAEFWRTFRWCVHKAFGTADAKTTRVGKTMQLSTPLGKWLPVPRNIWFPVYRMNGAVLWRTQDDSSLTVMKATGAGFFTCSHRTTVLPVDSHPVPYRVYGEELWTQRQLDLQRIRETPLQPGHIITDSSTTETNATVVLGSDGSTNLLHRVATCAWIVYQDTGRETKACYALHNITSLSSYRSELEGIYRALLQLQRLRSTPDVAFQWCDNEAAVDKANQSYFTPKQMLLPDMDIVLAIRHICTQLERSSEVICRHVYGHQDTRTTQVKRTGNNNDSHDAQGILEEDTATLPVRLNVECDKLATETTATLIRQGDTPHLPPVIEPPYAGSKALLRIGTKWVTTASEEHIRNARWESSVREYCYNKYIWTRSTFEKVDWRIIGATRRKLTPTQQMQTSKIIHGWLPVMHMQAHVSGLTQCPGCPCADETMEHLLQCPNHSQTKRRKEKMIGLRKKLMKLGFPRVIMEAIRKLLSHHCDGTPPIIPQHPGLARAVQDQLRIGLHLLPRGLISTQWLLLLQEYAVEHPDRAISGFLKTLWLDFIDDIWRGRNKIVHKQENLHRLREDTEMANKLQWFIRHRYMIARSDHHLLEYTEDDVNTMTTRRRCKLVDSMTRLMAVYGKECQQVDWGQRTITDYFQTRG